MSSHPLKHSSGTSLHHSLRPTRLSTAGLASNTGEPSGGSPPLTCQAGRRVATPLAIVRDAKDFLRHGSRPNSPLQSRRRISSLLDLRKFVSDETEELAQSRLPSLGGDAQRHSSCSTTSAPPTRGPLDQLHLSTVRLPSPPKTDPPRRRKHRKGASARKSPARAVHNKASAQAASAEGSLPARSSIGETSVGSSLPESRFSDEPALNIAVRADCDDWGDADCSGAGQQQATSSPSRALLDSSSSSLPQDHESVMGFVRGSHFSWMRGELIGKGTLGTVWKVLNRETGQLMAVKEVLLDTKDKADEKFRAALQNEIELYKDLKDPHIVSYFGNDYLNGTLYIYLEYMPGGSIAQVLSQFGPLDESISARYMHNLLQGLEYLHTRDPPVLHRDIKGANILVGLNSIVKLSDFGCSKRSAGTMVQTLRGSVPWMAPEVMRQAEYGRKADIWSIGCVLIEMATAAAPWGHFDNCLAAMVRIAMSDETPPVPDHLSEPCRDLVRLCTCRAPEERPCASELLQHEFVAGLLHTSAIDESWEADLH